MRCKSRIKCIQLQLRNLSHPLGYLAEMKPMKQETGQPVETCHAMPAYLLKYAAFFW